MKILAIHFVRHWLAPVPESLRPSPPVMLDVAIGKRKVCALAVPVSRLMLPQLLAQTHRKSPLSIQSSCTSMKHEAPTGEGAFAVAA